MTTAIVGAGAAGLSLALMLEDECVIFEKEDHPGGLCRSTFIDDFTFDIGPHILGGIPRAVEWIVASTGIQFVEGQTRNVAYYDHSWHPHPFEREQEVDAHRRKLWNSDHLLQKGLKAQRGRKPGGVARFRYPATGGYQALTDAWATRLGETVRYGSRASVEDLLDDYETVVWTGPRSEGIYNSLTTATAFFEGEPPPYTAIYLPDDTTPFHRLSFPAAFSLSNAPEGAYSVQCEASYRAEWDFPDPEPLFAELGFGEPVRVHWERTTHAYPVPLVTLPREQSGITYHGRTGAHSYMNCDGVVDASMRLAAQLNS